MASSGEKTSIISTLKIYVFPSLVTILAMMIWRDVTELRADVKSLLAQSNIDKTKIESLQKEVQMLQNKVFNTTPKATSMVTWPDFDRYFKHEDFFDVKKYIPKKEA